MKGKKGSWRIAGIALTFAVFLYGCASTPAEMANDRGVALAQRQDYEGSIIEFSESIRLNPKYVLAYYNLGLSYYHLGDYDSAVENFVEANRLKPRRYQKDLKFAEDARDYGTTGGIFVLTDIPADYNGKYAYFQATLSSGEYIFGFASANSSTKALTLVQITNGQVSLPMWATLTYRYFGNDTVLRNAIGIFDNPTVTSSEISDSMQAAIPFESITFSNGNVTKSVNDGTVIK